MNNNPKIQNNQQIKHVYFVPGLAAGIEIFELINLPKNKFELHYICWLIPKSKDESLSDYAFRMSQQVAHRDAILVGVSFGGIIVQEMKKYVNPSKVVIISSAKNKNELSFLMRFSKKSRLHKILPYAALPIFEKILMIIGPNKLKNRLKLYEKYLSIRNPLYLSWATNAIVNWDRSHTDNEVIHIHGTSDRVFSVKNLKNYIPIEKATHVMILTHAKKISQKLAEM